MPMAQLFQLNAAGIIKSPVPAIKPVPGVAAVIPDYQVGYHTSPGPKKDSRIEEAIPGKQKHLAG